MPTARERAQQTARKATKTARQRRDPLVKAEQERTVVKLWLAGATSDEIEHATQLSRTTVYRIRRAALDRALPDRDVAVVELRERELLTLDRLQRGHWTLAIGGNTASAKIVLACIAQRARMLGLDAPVKIDATIKSELDAQIEQLIEQLGAEGVVITEGSDA